MSMWARFCWTKRFFRRVRLSTLRSARQLHKKTMHITTLLSKLVHRQKLSSTTVRLVVSLLLARDLVIPDLAHSLSSVRVHVRVCAGGGWNPCSADRPVCPAGYRNGTEGDICTAPAGMKTAPGGIWPCTFDGWSRFWWYTLVSIV